MAEQSQARYTSNPSPFRFFGIIIASITATAATTDDVLFIIVTLLIVFIIVFMIVMLFVVRALLVAMLIGRFETSYRSNVGRFACLPIRALGFLRPIRRSSSVFWLSLLNGSACLLDDSFTFLLLQSSLGSRSLVAIRRSQNLDYR